ncbi:phage portal protein [Streptomyces sp. NRRL S-1813]|uniref:phage portal protein n=1 Tax=Streptomyces sp. NRRL S-1813 TaxID=1463888 RepID=UPI00055C2B55|nr:phage portal protein [Streptomyces sp. NRRL S-1813]
MSFVVSSGQLATTGAGVTPGYAAMPLPAAPWEYAEIWRTQPQVRTVIGFLARNVAQLGVHVFRRLSDTDRERLTDHPLAQLLAEPVPRMTTYRWVERLVSDVALYDNAYGIKLRLDGRLRVLPVPPTLIRPYGGNWIAPEYYETAGGRDFAVEDVVHIHGYTPEGLTYGSSPMESLRELLLESSESAKTRAAMWRGGARMTGVLKRPADAPEWGTKEKVRFREMWRSFTQGGGAEGGTPILEDGMEYVPVGLNPQQAQYIEARKLTREECAAAYFIPPPLIGILDHATYSNIKEQHAHLYQDTLGPWLVMLEQEFGAQILPDLPGDSTGVYCEFNIQAKMRGSFEEQAAAASTATGGPWMTRNEIRARNNLPAVAGGDELIVPMNVTEGGLASPRDTAPEPDALPKARGLALVKSGRPADLGTGVAEQDDLTTALVRWTEKAAKKLLDAAGAKAGGLPDLLELWAQGHEDRLAQLQTLLADHGYRLAQVGAWDVLNEHNPEADGWSAEVMLAWILAAAQAHAEQHEEAGRKAVAAVQDEGGDGWRDGLKAAAGAWATAADVRAATAATELRSFGGHDAAEASGLTKKIWRTGGKNPRASHKAQDGERVSLDDVFSNGLRWPGDGQGAVKETARCNCTLDYAKEG